MKNNQEYVQIAKKVLERTLYHESTELITQLAIQMELTDSYGMNELNKVLIDNTKTSSRNFLDLIAESNFGVQLAKSKLKDSTIIYEPIDFNNVDFVLQSNEVVYCIQMKRLANNERENRRNKTITQIKRMFKDIKFGKFCSIKFARDFNENDIEEFVKFSALSVNEGKDDKNYFYPSRENIKAVIKFFPPNVTVLNHLKIGITGDKDMMIVTDEDTDQIKKSLKKAIGAFKWNSSDSKVNLVAIEADNFDNIDLSAAMFGTELFNYSRNGNRTWNRKDDGFLHSIDTMDKISGTIALRRIEASVISPYHKTFFINDRFSHQVDLIKKIIGFDEIFTYKDLP